MGVTGPRNMLQLSFSMPLGAFFWGKTVSTTGVWIHAVAAAIVIYEITGSALWVGLVSAAQFAPQVFTPFFGRLADRGRLAFQVVLGRVVCCVGSFGVACAYLSSGETTRTPIVILLGSLVVGVGFAVGGPAQQSLIHDIVRRDELSAAVTLNSVPMTMGRVLGPALGAALYSQAGPVVAFLVAGLTGAFFVAVLVALRLPNGLVDDSAVPDRRLRLAARHVLSDRPLRTLMVMAALASLAGEPALTLAPSIAARSSGSPALVGALTTGFGVGAAAGFLVVGTLRRFGTLLDLAHHGLVLMFLGVTGLAVSPSLWANVILLGVIGFGFTLTSTNVTSLIQQQAPSPLRGRIMGLWMLAFLGSRPLASAFLGGVTDIASERVALALTAVIVLALGRWSRRATADG